MLMAAGLGTRLRPFTDLTPKAFLPLMGVPIAQFAVDALAEAGVKRIVANVHHLASSAKAETKNLDLGGATLEISDESELLLGSAGGIRKALPLLGDQPFFLLNADVLCDASLDALARQHEKLRDRWGVWMTLTIFPISPGTAAYREIRFNAAEGLATELVMEPAYSRPFWVGSAVIEPEALKGIPAEGPAEFVPTILLPALRARKVGVHLAEGSWHDIGNPSVWLDAHLAMIEGLETGKLHKPWRDRIEARNKRVGQKIWAHRKIPPQVKTIQWAGPCYWNPMADQTAQAPEAMGPATILYGPATSARMPAQSIAYRGQLWVKEG